MHYLSNYQPPAFLVDRVELSFDLEEVGTQVAAKLSMRPNPAGQGGSLRLDGEGLETLALRLDGQPLSDADWCLEQGQLVIAQPPQGAFVLETLVRIAPETNRALEGLYRSGGIFCTQCEAEGFRRITWFPDRPDVLATYLVRIKADAERYPVLLSNGNPLESGPLADGRHFAIWEDPFPKPCYLFALVAGELAFVEDWHQTPSGRRIRLRIYVEQENLDKCGHAMTSLKKAMAWDEQRYGLECDLDVYNIVAVNDFNMGAMENKGLNVFNSKCVLARPDTATDADYLSIEGVIAHEYFHNWSGNRITCRDWFQLALKEGLTVYRDQEFSADMNSRGVKRIQDVRLLRTHQFAEDDGPMAHPVRPDHYEEINNFYTLTVYEKGAELARMLATLIGPEAWRRGADLYFTRHDGQAVTIEDFLAAMAEASGRDLGQFLRWYQYAGTPRIGVAMDFDAQRRQLRLHLHQSLPDSPNQPQKPALHIPVSIGLLGADGRDLLPEGSRVLELIKASQTFVFEDIDEQPLLSINRGFRAPVKLLLEYSDAELCFLMRHDTDGFNRWDAAQRLAQRVLLTMVAQVQAGRTPEAPGLWLETFTGLLEDAAEDEALLAETLSLPSEGYLADCMDEVDIDAIHEAREALLKASGLYAWQALMAAYERNAKTRATEISPQAMGQRRLKNLALGYMIASGRPEAFELCLSQYQGAENMTDSLAALALLADSVHPKRTWALANFESRWRTDTLVMDKWFGVQAQSSRSDTLEQVQRLMQHPSFRLDNPNKVRALIGSFCNANPLRFHAVDGSGYSFLVDQVLKLDNANPQVAARLLRALSRWRRYAPSRRALMRQQLERVLAKEGLSGDLHEVAKTSLE